MACTAALNTKLHEMGHVVEMYVGMTVTVRKMAYGPDKIVCLHNLIFPRSGFVTSNGRLAQW